MTKLCKAILIGSVVATFLLNIGLALQAIELCKENLVLLSNKALIIEKLLGQLLCKKIYPTMFKAYRRVGDHTNAIAYSSKLLAIYSQCGDTVQEGLLSIMLAQILYIGAKVCMLRQNNSLREQSQSY